MAKNTKTSSNNFSCAEQAKWFLDAGLIPALKGKPGSGKTSWARAFAEELGRELVTVLCNGMEYIDTAGVRHVIDGQVRQATTDFVEAANKANGQVILSFDELTTASPESINPLLSFFQDRQSANGVKLHEDTMIIVAYNDANDIIGGQVFSSALSNRFAHIDWVLSSTDYSQGLLSNWGKGWEKESVIKEQVSALFSNFIKDNPALTNVLPDTEEERSKPFPTPRSWSNSIDTITSYATKQGYETAHDFMGTVQGQHVTQAILNSLVGTVASTTFITWWAGLKLPRLDDVRANPASFDWNSQAAASYALVSMLIKDINATTLDSTMRLLLYITDKGNNFTSVIPSVSVLTDALVERLRSNKVEYEKVCRSLYENNPGLDKATAERLKAPGIDAINAIYMTRLSENLATAINYSKPSSYSKRKQISGAQALGELPKLR